VPGAVSIAPIEDDQQDAAAPAVPTAPANPFGITGGSGRAGVITPVPAPSNTEGPNGGNAVQPR
jgi:hypothetical protein